MSGAKSQIPLGPVPLGPFVLERPIGRGGMAEVWLGVHRAQQQKVAVKVLTGERAREEAFIRALRNEIHNVARLHHPGIILLFDNGEVDAEAEEVTGGRMVAGSPWFAMELASHGALSPRRLPLPWTTTRMLLLSLLDALAHAHARGVIHRDIKPGNILLCAPDDPRPGLKLTDFGIAAPLGEHIDGEAESGRLSGTPRYMAPEQFQALWRDFGAWTDLYALGCIAYQLATGKAPFSGDALRLGIAHCHDVPTPPKPAHEGFPPGFDAWVLRLLEKDPSRRFRCAADAAWGLLCLKSAEASEEDPTVAGGWEEALRSLKPAPGSGEADISGGETVALTPGSADLAAEGEPDGSRLVVDASPDAVAQPSESTNAATIVDRPTVDRSRVLAPPERRPEPEGTAPSGRPALASGSSEEITAATVPLASSQGPLASADEPGVDELFPMIAPEVAPSGAASGAPSVARPRALDDDAEHEDEEENRPLTDPPALVDTTFAPNVPWTELAALSPKESVPTLSGRALHVGQRRHEAVDESALAPRSPPPLPPTWRRPGPQAPVRHLLGAGLGLYGLRQIPLVDRDQERDLVWQALQAVHEGLGSRVVVIRGPAGIGKTRLAEWLVERAAEVGAAVALRAGHGPGGGPLDGLPGLIALHARTIGLAKRPLARRLVDIVRRQGAADVYEALALAELLQPSGDAPEGGKGGGDEGRDAERVRFDSVGERHAVALRYLVRSAAERPVVAWLDDVQWGADALAFARHLLEDPASQSARILLVLSASEEALGERRMEAAALEELMADSRVVEVRLSHLPEKDHRALVEELLGLEGSLAGAVAARTSGNPLFAVQLVGDFVSRGVLELTPEGFALRRGEQAAFPDDLHGVWSERIARVLRRTPPGSQHALELGSVIGSAGDDGEWQALCDEVGIHLSPQLIDELLVARLLVPDDAGLRFAHAMLRESVLRVAAEEGRLEDHHRAAARMLAKRYGDRRRAAAERIGRHLLLAGDVEAALPYLLRAAEESARTTGYAQAHMILAERDAGVDKLGLPEDDPRRAEGWVLKATLLIEEGRTDEAQMWAALALRYRDDPRHVRVVARALRAQALVSVQQAQWEEATRRFNEARAAAESMNDSELTGLCLTGLADAAYYRGRLDDSGALYSHALALCQERGDEAGMATCLWNLAYVSLWRGEAEPARELLIRQQKLARRSGHRTMIANGKNALGDLERFSGRYDDAEARYDDALRLLDAIGSGKRRTVRVNMAMNALGRGQLERAQTRARDVLPEVMRVEPALSALCHGVLAAVAAHARDWQAFDEHVRVLAASRPEREIIDADGAWLFEIIGDHARAQGDDGRAAFAYENALELWRTLGRQDRVDGVDRALGKIGTVPTLRRR
jgi:eukaryotic-like serine/threonine-protein kinase